MKFEIVNDNEEHQKTVKANLQIIQGGVLVLLLNGYGVVRIYRNGVIDTDWSSTKNGTRNAGTIIQEVIYGV